MAIILWILIFVVSIYILAKSADYFTKYSEKLGKILNFPPFVIGVIIIAIGTSLPEFATSLIATFKGTTEVVAGDVMGSIIANIFLGIGIAAVFARKHIKMKWDIFYGDLPIFAGGIVMLFFTLRDGLFSFTEGLIFIVGYILYLNYVKQIRKIDKTKDSEKFSWKVPIMLILSLVIVYFASHYTIESLLKIAEFFNIGISVLTSSLVAIGTSLPEIVVALSVVRKGKFDILMGDIIGSNIFDLFVIFGVTGLIRPLVIEPIIITLVLPFLIASLFILWIISVDKEISHSEGAFMILIYVLFLGKLFGFI